MNEQRIQEILESIQNSFGCLDKIEQAKILEEITAKIAAHVTSENKDEDAKDGIFDALGEITESVQ